MSLKRTIQQLIEDVHSLGNKLSSTTKADDTIHPYGVDSSCTPSITYSQAVKSQPRSMPIITSQQPQNMRRNNERPSYQSLSDRKFNLVFLGIPESPAGTDYRKRLQNDYEAIHSAISSGSSKDELSSVSLRDYIRLGKYNRQNERPRPILVKFNCQRCKLHF